MSVTRRGLLTVAAGVGMGVLAGRGTAAAFPAPAPVPVPPGSLPRGTILDGPVPTGRVPRTTVRTEATTADGVPTRRLPVTDVGPVIRHGAAIDVGGAREPIVFRDPLRPPGEYAMYYDGCSPEGWLACLAVSKDGGVTWAKAGRRLKLGPAGSRFDSSASSPWLVKDPATGTWVMYYLGAGSSSPVPNRVPIAPYTTCKATAPNAGGPWNQSQLTGPRFYAPDGAWHYDQSPGPVIRYGGQWRMFYTSAAKLPDGSTGWGIGVASSPSLVNDLWKCKSTPCLPLTERLENAAVFQDPGTGLWWLFSNHIGSYVVADKRYYYGDSVWAYWSTDPFFGWSTDRRCLVIDRTSSPWATGAIGMPSVQQVGDKLAIYYDASPTGDLGHMGRDVGLAWAQLPLAAT